MSACKSVQKAGDLPQGGVFTQGLLKALRGSGGNISYVDLFVRARATTEKIRSVQTPQIETVANFNAYTRFLDGSPEGSPNLYEAKFSNESWIVKCGAIHGLPLSSSVPIKLEIQTIGPSKEIIGKAQIMHVGAQKSKFEFIDDIQPDPNKSYRALISHLPAPPEFVMVHGDDKNGIEQLKRVWDHSQNILYLDGENSDGNPSIEVRIREGHFHLRDLYQRRHILSEPISPESAALIVDGLGKMVKWRRMIDLDNPQSNIRNYVQFELKLIGNKPITSFLSAPEIKIYGSKENLIQPRKVEAILVKLQPELNILNENIPSGQELYCYLLQLRGKYSITASEPGVVYRQSEHFDKINVRFPLWKKKWAWGIETKENESTSYLKLLISTEELDYHQLLQHGVGGDRDILFNWNPFQMSDDWCAFTTRLALLYQGGKINDSAETQLANGDICIHAHPTAKAKVGISSSQKDDYSQDPTHKYTIFDRPGFTLIDFAPQESLFPQQILEMEIEEGGDLQNNPLEIILKYELSEGEALIPLGFDGEDFKLLGDVVLGNAETKGEIKTQIHQLPIPQLEKLEGDFVKNPFGGDKQHISLFKALRLGFFKMELDQWYGVEGGKVLNNAYDLIKNTKKIEFISGGMSKDAQLMASLTLAPNVVSSDTSNSAKSIMRILTTRIHALGIYQLQNLRFLIHKQGEIGFILK